MRIASRESKIDSDCKILHILEQKVSLSGDNLCRSKKTIAKIEDKCLLLAGTNGEKTPIDSILQIGGSGFANKEISELAEMILLLMDIYRREYNGVISDKLYSSSSGIVESSVFAISRLMSMVSGKQGPTGKPLKIKEVYKDPDVSKTEAESVISILEMSSTLIPDKYKKGMKPVTVLIRPSDSKLPPCSSVNDGSFFMILNYRKNNIELSAEAFHEYLHLIEKSNQETLMLASNDFVKSRAVFAKDDCRHRDADTIKNNSVVIKGRFIDPYVGRTYGNVFGPKSVPTEVLSVAGELLFLDPIGLMVKDFGHFKIIMDLINGKIGTQ